MDFARCEFPVRARDPFRFGVEARLTLIQLLGPCFELRSAKLPDRYMGLELSKLGGILLRSEVKVLAPLFDGGLPPIGV